jgi:8-oxo-dGTP pyrophosphatase MutT (NUDIX family)
VATLDEVLAGKASLIDNAAGSFEEELVGVIDRFAYHLAKLAGQLDTDKGKLVRSPYNLEFTVNAFDEIVAALDEAGYADSVEHYLEMYGPVVEKVRAAYKVQKLPAPFTKVMRQGVEIARETDRSWFAEIGNQAVREIQRSLTQAVIIERDYSTFVKDLRARVAGTDKRGAPLARYANTFAGTAISQFDAEVTGAIGDEAGIEYYKYSGPSDMRTRPWCAARLKNNTPLTRDEIDALGKSRTNSTGEGNFIGRGGWNCRHMWVPVPVGELKRFGLVERGTGPKKKKANAPPDLPLPSQTFRAGDPPPPWATPVEPEFWRKHKQRDYGEALASSKPGKKFSSGVVVEEPDGKIWLYEPKNHFGGYQMAFPKGQLERDLSPQQNALKEAWEETGLEVELTGFLGDFDASTTTTRLYTAKRKGGDPTKFLDETESVRLMTLDEAEVFFRAQNKAYPLAALAEIRKRREAAERAAAPVPEPEPEPGDTWPTDPDRLEVVKRLGGSTGAELVRDSATGRRFVRKRGANKGHLLEESAADGIYRALGASVPEHRLYETTKGPVKLAEYVEGDTLGALKANDPSKYQKATAELRKHFAADAVLGNWDVVGMNYDNVLVGKDGTVYRIDNGGSLRYRAQGAKKAEFGNRDVSELWTLRDKKTNKQTADVFGDLEFREIVDQLDELGAKWDDVKRAIDEAPGLTAADRAELESGLRARFAEAGEVRDVGRTMFADKWKSDYTDRFSFHAHEIRRDMVPLMAKRLTNAASGSGTTFKDEKGVSFDALRSRKGPGTSVVTKFAEHLHKHGLDPSSLAGWMSDQAVTSWSSASMAFKWFVTGARDVARSAYYWHGGEDISRSTYEGYVSSRGAEYERMWAEARMAQHALTYEIVRRMEFEGNDVAGGTVRVARTESSDVMRIHKMKKGDRKVMTRGALESYSISRTVVVKGSQLTVQEIPHTRVFGVYFQERTAGSNHSAFMGDTENEFVCMAEGVEADYIGTTGRGKAF